MERGERGSKETNGECEYVHVSFTEKCLWKTKLEDSKDQE